MDYLKNLLIIKNCRKEIAFELTQANDAQINSLTEQAGNLETHQIVFLIDKCAEYIKELKLTNNPRLWLEVAVIDLANLTENTSLVELQNRIARLESGNVQPVKVAVYKTAPSPVLKSEISHAKPDVVMQKEVAKTQESVSKKQVSEPVKDTQMVAPQQYTGNEEFSPMPKSKPVDCNDVSVLWGQLLTLIQSPPTRALLKQWANPVKISAEETILSMKNEIFLTQIQSGSKKAAVEAAVDALFSQQNSTVVVRLPLPEDVQIKAAPPRQLSQSKPKPMPKAPEPEPQEEITQDV